MASSSDAVRNFIYDFHRHNLRQGWQIIQQLEQKELDSWERIHQAYCVKNPNEDAWDATDDKSVADFALACPFLVRDLAAQLAVQAALFVRCKEPQALKRGNSGRFGSLRDRIDRLYLRERTPSQNPLSFSRGMSYHQAGKLPKTAKLVPFMEAVQNPRFSTVAE